MVNYMEIISEKRTNKRWKGHWIELLLGQLNYFMQWRENDRKYTMLQMQVWKSCYTEQMSLEKCNSCIWERKDLTYVSKICAGSGNNKPMTLELILAPDCTEIPQWFLPSTTNSFWRKEISQTQCRQSHWREEHSSIVQLQWWGCSTWGNYECMNSDLMIGSWLCDQTPWVGVNILSVVIHL